MNYVFLSFSILDTGIGGGAADLGFAKWFEELQGKPGNLFLMDSRFQVLVVVSLVLIIELNLFALEYSFEV